ncbi:MAG TPA: cell wall-binding repeat-containing protein [Egibacteraceae bacterium]|nr:cell wall-binding repeat-containing protein [Egibacteraceae bacterium]
MVGRAFVAGLVALALVVHTPGPLRASGHCPAGVVALTFDDGPGVHTPAVLDALAARSVPATFFPVGRLVDQRPHVVRRAAGEGHVIANHTYGHENLTRLSDAQIRATVVRTTQAVERAQARPSPIVRPPYGATSARVDAVLRAAGYTPVLWTVDPQDWRGPSADTITWRVLGHLRAGSVVVLHDGSPRAPNTIAALPRIIDGAHARGFCFGVLDDAGAVRLPVASPPPPPPPRLVAAPQQVEVVSGRDRYATSVAVSRATWPDRVHTAVLAEAEAWADAVAGGVLAATVGGPLLLTRRDRLDTAVAEELGRLAPEVAYLVGPLDPAVEDAVWGQGVEVRRLRGVDRYATSELIAATAAAHGADASTLVVTTGRQFPDALAASALAAGERHPILLTRPAGDQERLGAAVERLGASRIWVVGGPAAVPDAAVAGLQGLERIAGATRTATAASLADRAAALGYERRPILVSGWRHPDGVSASGLAAHGRRPILLTASATLSPDAHAWIDRHGSRAVTVVGGPAAVGPGVLCQLRTGYDRPAC